MVRLENLLPWADRDRGLAGADAGAGAGADAAAGAGAGADAGALLTPTLEAPLGALRPVVSHPQCCRQSTLVLHSGQGFTEAGLLPSLDSVQV
jgi:hypothetical protein